jgi:type IX secretion system PorP/SprF family membrane protein
MKRKHLLRSVCLFACCMYACVTKAQDPHFSQYFASPMTLNPALTGRDIADWRVVGLFRSQWWGSSISPYNTTAASLEKSFRSNKSGKSVFGMGLSFLSDASNSGLLKNNYFTLGLAYNIALDAQGNDMLGVGLQGTYANRLIDANKFTFQSQFGSMGFQRSTPSGDPISILSSNYFDMNMGVSYAKKYKTGGYNLGVSIYHASQPTEGVVNSNTYSISRRISLQTGMYFNLTNLDQIHVSALADYQGENSIYTLGGAYTIRVGDHDSYNLDLGLWYRVQDAIYPYIALGSKNWNIGISYDVLTSPMRSDGITSVQSMEVSLGLLFGNKRGSGKTDKMMSF